MIVTAVLTTGVGRVVRGKREAVGLIDELLGIDHGSWESILYLGDVEYYTSRSGPVPNQQMRVSASPAKGAAALNYLDHDDPGGPMVISFNPSPEPPEVDLIFNGSTGATFPRSAAIPIAAARTALIEWLDTGTRPECIQWVPL
ncbi:Imm1 family immunity protein [Actinokineospora sp. NPDC004072]